MFGKKKGPTLHRVTVSATYQIGNGERDGGLSESLWTMTCSGCGWRSSSGFLHTAQKATREHLGLPVDWDSTEIEVIGMVEDE
jgi:hypothetical protein